MSSQNYGQKPPGYPPASPPAGQPPSPVSPQPGGYPMGTPPQMSGGSDVSKPKNETLALVSLICGIVSLLFIFPGCCCYLSFVAPAPGVAAIVTGILGRKKIEQDPINLTGNTLALVGMICGGVACALFLVFVVLYILGIAGSVIQNMPRNF